MNKYKHIKELESDIFALNQEIDNLETKFFQYMCDIGDALECLPEKDSILKSIFDLQKGKK